MALLPTLEAFAKERGGIITESVNEKDNNHK